MFTIEVYNKISGRSKVEKLEEDRVGAIRLDGGGIMADSG